jgi:hypothetical protein
MDHVVAGGQAGVLDHAGVTQLRRGRAVPDDRQQRVARRLGERDGLGLGDARPQTVGQRGDAEVTGRGAGTQPGARGVRPMARVSFPP